jgi:hypothetical protein
VEVVDGCWSVVVVVVVGGWWLVVVVVVVGVVVVVVAVRTSLSTGVCVCVCVCVCVAQSTPFSINVVVWSLFCAVVRSLGNLHHQQACTSRLLAFLSLVCTLATFSLCKHVNDCTHTRVESI